MRDHLSWTTSTEQRWTWACGRAVLARGQLRGNTSAVWGLARAHITGDVVHAKVKSKRFGHQDVRRRLGEDVGRVPAVGVRTVSREGLSFTDHNQERT